MRIQNSVLRSEFCVLHSKFRRYLGIDASELARDARIIRPDVAIVIVSGYRLAEAPEYDGEFAQLGKPYTKSDLAAAVRKALECGGDRAGA